MTTTFNNRTCRLRLKAAPKDSDGVPLEFPVAFTKMSGTGNDFIVIDHRLPFLRNIDLSTFSRAVCCRKFSAGADGLILIENSATADFRWQFFNGDGSVAEMCGNGARCVARYAFDRGIAPAKMRFETMAGEIEAAVSIDGMVKLRLTTPTEIVLDQMLEVEGNERLSHSVNTGVPHAVLLVDDNRATPVVDWGRPIRYHGRFQPAGTNVNFAQVLPADTLHVRTYERGVEGETMACGTGAVASAIVAALCGKVKPPVTVITSGGERLIVHFSLATDNKEKRVDAVFLEGPANFIYDGHLNVEALRMEFTCGG